MEDFVKKSVQEPIIDSDTKSKIVSSPTDTPVPELEKQSFSANGGFKEFVVKNKWYFVALVLGVCIISIMSFLAFRASPPPGEANVEVVIDAQKEFPSNGDLVVKVGITNNDSAKLVKLQLEMLYPEGVSYISSTPPAENLSGSIFKVPDLTSGVNTVILIRLKSKGSVGDEKSISAKLRYSYDNFNSTFDKQVSISGKVMSSELGLGITGPGTANNSQLVTYTFRYVNNSQEKLENGRIVAEFPQGFVFGSSEPMPPSVGKNIWNIDTIMPGQSGSINVTGTFKDSTPGESRIMQINYSVLDQNGSYLVQAVADFTTNIAVSPLLVTQELEQNSGSLIVDPGDVLTYLIRYQNNSTFAAKSVNIVLNIDSKAVDLTSIQAEGAQINGSTITWNPSSTANLDIVNPNEDGQLRFTVRLKNPPVKDSSKNVEVVTHVKIRSDEQETYIPGNDLNLKVSSISSIAVNLEHLEGPLPPKVGQSTFYKVTLLLKNLTNDINDGVVSASLTLPPGSLDTSSFSPQVESGKVIFDPASGKLKWNLGLLKAHTGDFSQPKTLSFLVSFNPSSSQAGTAPVLLKTILFTGKDSFTSADIKLNTEDLRTDGLEGNNSSQYGRVVN